MDQRFSTPGAPIPVRSIATLPHSSQKYSAQMRFRTDSSQLRREQFSSRLFFSSRAYFLIGLPRFSPQSSSCSHIFRSRGRDRRAGIRSLNFFSGSHSFSFTFWCEKKVTRLFMVPCHPSSRYLPLQRTHSRRCCRLYL